MNFFSSMFLVTLVLVLAIWCFVGYLLYKVGRKFGIGSFGAYCIPVYNIYLLCKCADVSAWNTLGVFIPVVNIYSTVSIWGSIAERLGKSYWLYGITILFIGLPVFILAFDGSNPYPHASDLDEEEVDLSKDWMETAGSSQADDPVDAYASQEPDGMPVENLNEKAVELPVGKKYKPKKKLAASIARLPIISSFASNQISELVGIDIGTASIKICSLKNTKGFFSVQEMAIETFEQDLLSDGHIVDVELLAGELRRIFDEHKIKCRNVACALSSYSVISKKISLPLLEEEELEGTIGSEVENAIPFPMKDIYYSYYVMGIDPEKPSMMDVKIVAAKKEIVDAYIAVFNMADLNLQILDVDVFDSSNLVEQIYAPKEHSVVIVDIGASVTNIAILNDENIEFTREILMGGRYLTNLIQKSAKLNYKDAEARKLAADANITYLFEDFIFNIASEINKTVRFYLATKPKDNIGRIYVTGGSSLLPGLKEKIVEDTGIEVEVIDPFLLVQPRETGMKNDENMKEFMAVPLYLSTRVTDLML